MSRRKKLSVEVKTILLTESGYRCAVPTCRGILALDMHHLVEVSEGGGNDASNLIALCPSCHALYHRKTIKQESLYVYKAMLVALSQAFDFQSIDRLLFLNMMPENFLVLSGDGVLQFDRLIANDLVGVEMKANNDWEIVTYIVNINPKGKLLIEAWKSGDRERVKEVLLNTVVVDNTDKVDGMQ